jgi:hypothetical protein
MEEEAVGRDEVRAARAVLGVQAAAGHRPPHRPTRPDKARRLGYKAKQVTSPPPDVLLCPRLMMVLMFEVLICPVEMEAYFFV